MLALWLAARDPRTPWSARIVAFVTAAYALSPVDLIPDFIPVLGLLDDLLIVPAGIWLAVRLIPAALMAQLRAAAADAQKPPSAGGLLIVLAIWIASAWAVWTWWSMRTA